MANDAEAYAARWYWCDLAEVPDEQPDFSKVPEDRREIVRERWLNSTLAAAQRCQLWGPQIETISRHPAYEVTVIEPVDNTPEREAAE